MEIQDLTSVPIEEEVCLHEDSTKIRENVAGSMKEIREIAEMIQQFSEDWDELPIDDVFRLADLIVGHTEPAEWCRDCGALRLNDEPNWHIPRRDSVE